jgi:hypothetical protein
MSELNDFITFNRKQYKKNGGVNPLSFNSLTLSGAPKTDKTDHFQSFKEWNVGQKDLARKRAADIVQRADKMGDRSVYETLSKYQPQLAETLEQRSIQDQLYGSSKLTGWILKNPLRAAIEKEQLNNLSSFEGLIHSIGRGFDKTVTGYFYGADVREKEDKLDAAQFQRLGYSPRAVSRLKKALEEEKSPKWADHPIYGSGKPPDDKNFKIAKAIFQNVMDRGFSLFDSSREFNLLGKTNEELAREEGEAKKDLGAAFREQARNLQRINDTYGRSASVADVGKKVSEASKKETEVEQLTALADVISEQPGAFTEWIFNVAAESIPSIVAMAGAFYTTRNLTVAAGAAGVTSSSMGRESTFEKLVDEAGVNLNDPAQRRDLVNDVSVRTQLKDRSSAYAIIIGLMDALSGGVAGQALSKSVSGNLILQALAQSAMGGFGEGLALFGSDQEINAVDIAVEALAEFAGTPTEIVAAGGSVIKNRGRASKNAKLLDALDKLAKDSDLRKNAPKDYRDIINAITEGGPNESVFVDARQLDALFQSEGLTPEDFAEAIPGVTIDNFNELTNTDGIVEIPMSSLTTDIVDTTLYDKLKDHIKLAPDQMSISEARDFDSNVEEFVKLGKRATVRSKAEKIAGKAQRELSARLKRAGTESRVADFQSAQAIAFARTMADRLDISLGEFLKRYPLAEIDSPVFSAIPKSQEEQKERLFVKWAKTSDPVIEPDQVNETDFSTKKSRVLRAFHATTHDFDRFDASVHGGEQGLFGPVNYFTSSRKDAVDNYGPGSVDLWIRIEERAEQIQEEMRQDPDKFGLTEKDFGDDLSVGEARYSKHAVMARDIASSELKGGSDRLIEVFIRTQNPFVIDNDTRFFGKSDSNAKVSKKLNKLMFAVEKVAEQRGVNISKFKSLLEEFSKIRGTNAELEKLFYNSDLIDPNAFSKDNEEIGYQIFSKAIEELGFDSIILKNANERLSSMKIDPNTTHVQIFDKYNTNIKAVDNRGTFDPDDPRILYQEESGKRGSYLPSVSEGFAPIISLFEKSDRSTFLHESAHYYLDILEKIVTDNNAPEQLVKMYGDVKKWWASNTEQIAKEANTDEEKVKLYLEKNTTGDKDIDRNIRVALQEQWARAYETYLLEGKAPSNVLREAFEAFTAWLLNIYKQAKNLDVEINDDLRNVFDRLLATDQEIDAAQLDDQLFSQVASVVDRLNIEPKQQEDLLKLAREAKGEARQKLLPRIMKDIRKERTEQYKKERDKLEKEIRGEVEQRPVNRVREWLINGKWLGDNPPDFVVAPEDLRFDTDLLEQEFGKRAVRRLSKLHAKGTGVSANDIAFFFNDYKTGVDLVNDLMKTPFADKEINFRVRQELKKRHGDLLNKKDIEEAALKAINGDKKEQLIAYELKLIARAARKKTISLADASKAERAQRRKSASILRPLTRAQASEIARRMLSNRPIREAARPSQYEIKERAAARRALLAISKGDLDAAFDAKQDQMINYALYRESQKVNTFVNRVKKYAAKFRRKEIRKKLRGTYIDAIDEILETYEFRKSASAKRGEKRGRLLAHIEFMKEQNRENELYIPDHLVNNVEPKSYQKMTVSEIEDIYNALQNLEHTVKIENELNESVKTLIGQMDKNLPDKPANRVQTPADKRRRGLREYLNVILTASSLLRKIDNYDVGEAYKIIKGAIDQAQNWATNEREKMVQSFTALNDVFDKKTMREMAVRSHIPELKGSFNRWDLISMALNMGNADNLNRLSDLESSGFTKAQIDFVKESLSKKEWDYVQSCWDYIGTYWPLIAEREKRLTGVTPKKVAAMEVETPHGVYAGGYYPIVYDGDLSAVVSSEDIAEVQKQMLAGQFGKAQTRNGHLKERKKGKKASGGRPLKLGVEPMYGHMSQVVHDLAFSEPITNSWRVLHDKRVDEAFRRKGLLKDFQALEIWLQDTATGQITAGGSIGRLAVRAKNGFTLSKLAFNVNTVLVQALGISHTIVALGPRHAAIGYSDYLSNIARASSDIIERSVFMKNRQSSFNPDMSDVLNHVRLSPMASRLDEAQTIMAASGFWTMTKMQFHSIDLPMWLGAYRQGLEKFKNNEDEAIAYADHLVGRAHASGVFGDRTPFERGTLDFNTRQNGFIKLFSALGSVMYAKFNLAYEVVGKAKRDIDGFNQKSFIAAARATAELVTLFTLEAIAYHLIQGSLPGMDDEDETGWAEFLARETALSAMATVPLVRDVGSALSGFDAGAYAGVIGTFGKLALQVGQGEMDLALFNAFSSSIGIATGLPTGQLNKIVAALAKMEEGDPDTDIRHLFLGPKHKG